MKRLFSSDHHYGHFNILEYDKRGLQYGGIFKDIEHMNTSLVDTWNEQVSKEDEVYYIGDFSMSPRYVDSIVPLLNGNKYLICGNHDKPFFSGKHADRYLAAGFKDILPNIHNMTLKNGEEVVLSHLPYESHDSRYKKFLPKDEGKWLIHGHVHLAWKIKNKQINVGISIWNYNMVTEDKIIEIIESNKNDKKENRH